MEFIINIEKISKRYDKTIALNNLTLNVRNKSIFGILGPNGAGKTTLISILTTLTQPTSGTASISGYDLRRKPNEIRKNIGVVFQDSPIDISLTPEDILDIQLRLHKIRDNKKNIIEKFLKLTGLYEVKKRKTGTFSEGMKRKMEVARGIIHNPKILFLDEPTAGLDPKTRIDLWNHFLMLNKKMNVTLFIATNHMEEADALCTDICIINKGTKVVCMPKKELLTKYKLTEKILLKTSSNKDALRALVDFKPVLMDKDIIINSSSSAKDLEQIIPCLRQKKINLLDFAIEKPRLQDVFMKLTKKK